MSSVLAYTDTCYRSMLEASCVEHEKSLTDEWGFILGDSSDVCMHIPSDSIHLTFTSPPYDFLRQYRGSIQHYDDSVWRTVLSELYRITVPGGVVAWNVADQCSHYCLSQTSFKQAIYAVDIGFAHTETIIWDKVTPLPSGNHARYKHTRRYEYIFIFVKNPPPRCFMPVKLPCKHAGAVNKPVKTKPLEEDTNAFRLDKKYRVTRDIKVGDDIWQVQARNNAVKYGIRHPAVFPEALADRVISTWSHAGDIVLDPFSGAGTTVAMAALQGRYGVGIEVNREFYEASQVYCKQRCMQKMLYV